MKLDNLQLGIILFNISNSILKINIGLSTHCLEVEGFSLLVDVLLESSQEGKTVVFKEPIVKLKFIAHFNDEVEFTEAQEHLITKKIIKTLE